MDAAQFYYASTTVPAALALIGLGFEAISDSMTENSREESYHFLSILAKLSIIPTLIANIEANLWISKKMTLNRKLSFSLVAGGVIALEVLGFRLKNRSNPLEKTVKYMNDHFCHTAMVIASITALRLFKKAPPQVMHEGQLTLGFLFFYWLGKGISVCHYRSQRKARTDRATAAPWA